MTAALLADVHRTPGAVGWIRRQVLRSVARLMEWISKLPGRPLNLVRVTEQVLVGGAVPRSAHGRLAALGVTHVIDLRAERCDDARSLERVGIELLHLPTPDRHGVPLESLVRGVSWALPRLDEGAQIFCHCEHGVGRGPLMAISLLVAQGCDPAEAYRAVRRVRWQAVLNDRQLAALAEFSRLFAGG